MDEIVRKFFNEHVLQPDTLATILEEWGDTYSPGYDKKTVQIILQTNLCHFVDWEKVMKDLAYKLQITVVYIIDTTGNIIKTYVDQRRKFSNIKCKK